MNDQVLRILIANDGAQVLAHLLRLGPKGRYNRFSIGASDESIENYVAQTFRQTNFYFGFFEQGTLRGLVEVHCMDATCQAAEMAFSIEQGFRGHGIGKRLFATAVALARRRSVRTLHIHCLAHNYVMVSLARAFHARLTFEDNDVSAVIAC